MKIIKKYTALKLLTTTINDVVNVSLNIGEIEGPYYSQTTPDLIHDSEQEAIDYAYKTDKYGS